MIRQARSDGRLLGINDRSQLADATYRLRERINERHLLAGVTMLDPARTYVDVVYHPTVGGTLNASSITDATPEFSLGGAAFASRTESRSHSQEGRAFFLGRQWLSHHSNARNARLSIRSRRGSSLPVSSGAGRSSPAGK